MKVALSHSMYYYDILKSTEFAMRICGEAVFEAKEEYQGYKRKAGSVCEVQEFHTAYKALEENIERFKEEMVQRNQEIDYE